MRIIQFVKQKVDAVRIFTYGGFSLREVLRYLLVYKWKKLKTLRASRWSIYEKKWENAIPTELSDLKGIFTFRYMNRTERKATKSLCAAIDANIKKENHQPYSSKVRAILEGSAGKLSTRWLEDTEMLATCGGLFLLSREIRQRYVGKLLKKYEKKKKVQFFDVQRMYKIFLGRGENEAALEVLDRAGKTWKKNHADLHRQMKEIALHGEVGTSHARETDTEADKRFREMVCGKSVAVLGPAAGPLDVDEVLREFDVKIRIAYRGMECLNESARRCGVDISYYNVPAGRYFAAQERASFFEDLKVAVFKELRTDGLKNLAHEGKVRPVSFTPRLLMLNGSPNMAQTILMDLFSFSPARVKLFNINLYLSERERHYQDGYNMHIDQLNIERIWYNYAHHNLTSNHELTKLWYEAGCFEADEELIEVLSLGTEEYLRRMENLD